MSNQSNGEPKVPSTGEDYANLSKAVLGQETTSTKETVSAKPTEFRDQVNSLIKEVTTDEAGKAIYPDGTPDSLRYAVAAEKKFRDTQAGFTKSQMSLKEAEAENTALREQLTKNSNTALEIPQDKLDELESLMYTDPQAWRTEMNVIENEHSAKVQAGLTEQMSEVRGKAGLQHEMERRINVLESFNEGREFSVTPEVLDNDIPPRITKKLADGAITFEDYLTEVDKYLAKGKVVANSEVGNGTSLNSGAGTSTPSQTAPNTNDGGIDYANVTF